MRDLWIRDNDLIVATHGRSFWILDDIAPLREITQSLANSEPHLFKPAPSYRVPRSTNTDTPLPPDEPAAANPPDGMIIDYYLPRSASGPVTVEILDAQGQLVRRFSSADQPPVSEAELKKQLIPLYWVRPFRSLPTDAGMHRWVWDLHYPPPTSIRHEYPIAAVPHDTPRFPLGPTAMPGQYTVRLTVNGKSYTAPVIVKMDPRVKTSTVSLAKKFQAETRLAAIVSQSSEAILQGSSIRAQTQKLTEHSNPAAKDALEALQKKLTTVLGAAGTSPAPPSDEVTLARVNSQASTLYAQVWPVDSEPTIAQMEALKIIDRDHADVMKRWNEFKTSELPALNRQLRGAGLSEINLQSNPSSEYPQADEE
jgi:hypothetical protein